MPRHNFEAVRGRITEIVVESKALDGNLLGDPAARRVLVHLPEGYDDSDADYPLLVSLAAFTGSGPKRLNWQAFGESEPQRIERLRAEGRMGPVVVAFPDSFTSMGGNQFVDTPVLGRWEVFLTAEMLPRLEDAFRLRRGRVHRAVYGKSSGGYGALVQGMRHAEYWNAVACHSGDMGFEWSIRPDFPRVLEALARHDGDAAAFVREFLDARKVSGPDLHVLMMLALAASYDPDPEAPLGIRLPVDRHTCELHAERWERWLAHDPVEMATGEPCREGLRSLALLFVDCGTRDPYRLLYGSRLLAKRLRDAGVEHVYEEFDDTHSGIDYRLDRSLPLLFEAIAG